MESLTRRKLVQAALAAPMAVAAVPREAAAQESASGPAAKFTLSCNLEIMFPRDVKMEDRIRVVADNGYKAFSYWNFRGRDIPAMLKAQKETGLQCGSTTGNAKTGWGTGLTKTGAEQAFLDDFREHAENAKLFGCQNLITFVGAVQKDIPWETQYRQIIDGLKRAGDLAEKLDVYLVLEPLNSVESPQMSVLTAKDGFKILRDVQHPRVKLDFDMYHLQLSEGNIINNLRTGLREKLIQFVEVGDVPGRKEPGTGEKNYPNIFKVLREEGYAGYVGLEHGTSKDPAHAMRVVKQMSGGL